MAPKKLSEDLSVSAQIDPSDIAALASAGFKSIICNRPDGEGADQPEYNAVAEAAMAEGMEVRYLPVSASGMQPSDITDFAGAYQDMAKPVLAYCRTGTRCTFLWAASQHGQMPSQEIVQAATDAGYDVSGFVQRMDAPRVDAKARQTAGTYTY